IGVHLSPAQADLCARYATLLIERNTDVNLTAITEPSSIARKHFLDSFTALAVRGWGGGERLVDVGSGAGFPGLALRIALPRAQVTLVEATGKKARFLEEVTRTLGLDGVEVRNERAEALAKERRERYDVGTARAVGSLGAVIEYLLPFLRVGGDAIAWKGRVDAELGGANKASAAGSRGASRISRTRARPWPVGSPECSSRARSSAMTTFSATSRGSASRGSSRSRRARGSSPRAAETLRSSRSRPVGARSRRP